MEQPAGDNIQEWKDYAKALIEQNEALSTDLTAAAGKLSLVFCFFGHLIDRHTPL